MAIESVVADPGAGGAEFATDQITGPKHVPYSKLMSGTDASEELIGGTAANGLHVDVTRVQGTVNVADGGGSVTVDNAALAVVGGGAEATALRVTLANDSTGVLSVDDNGGALTVDGTVNVGNFPAVQPVSDNGGALTVDGTVSVSGTVTVDSELTTADLDTGAGVDTRAVVGLVLAENGGGVLVGSANPLPISGAVSLSAAIPAGTNNIGDVDILSIAAGDNNIGNVDIVTMPNVTVVGAAAHDAAVSGNPVLVGVEARTADGTPVANGDVTRLQADTLGKQVVLQGSTHDMQANGTTNFTTTTAADVIAAAGAGVRIAVTSILVTNAHATVSTKVEIRDGTTVKIQGYAAAVGGGFALNAGGRPLFISTANTAVTGRCVTTGADVDVSISGYKIAN